MKKEENINREGDVVLVSYQDKPAAYARIEAVRPDAKKDWYQVTLLLLSIPSQTVTWILREEYINGAPFTMGGKSMKLEKVKRDEIEGEKEKEAIENGRTGGKKSAKIIPFKK